MIRRQNICKIEKYLEGYDRQRNRTYHRKQGENFQIMETLR